MLTTRANTQIRPRNRRGGGNRNAMALEWTLLGLAAVREVYGIFQNNRAREEEQHRESIQEEQRIKDSDEMYIQQSRMQNRARMEGAMKERNSIEKEIEMLREKEAMQKVMNMKQSSGSNGYYNIIFFALALFAVVLILKKNPHALSRFLESF